MRGLKYLVLSGVIIMLLCLWGCNDKIEAQIKEANDFGDSIVKSIANKDVRSFEQYFINDVFASSDFEKGIEHVFNIFEGEVQSVDDIGTNIGGRFSGRKKSIIPSVLLHIVTDKNEYILYFEYYQIDEVYQNKIIRLKLVVKEDNQETGAFNNHGGMGNKIGIYYPS